MAVKTRGKPSAPRIGITTSRSRGDDYYIPYRKAVQAAGAVPVDLPVGTRELPDVDGLLLPGGWDVDPALYGEEPDRRLGEVDRELDDTELRLFKQARSEGLPVLGICRGQQVINVALGGSLVQHLDDHDARAIGRSHLAHGITVVNSLHHQAVRELAPGLVESARGDDGTVEGVETSDGLVVAVQCHPEELTVDMPWARTLFERFVARAGSHTPRS